MLLQIDGVVVLTIAYLIFLLVIFLLPPAEVGYASTEAAICRCVLQNIVFLKMSQNLQAKPVSLAFETIASVNCYFTV